MTAGADATLRALIDAEAPMRPARAVEIALQIVEALVALHAEGRAHGDVCAEHIVMARNGRVSLLPAVPHTGPLDAARRADISNTAAILYELLTRAKPTEGTPVSQRTPAILPAGLDDVVARALDASHEARFDEARPFAQELRVCLLTALGDARKQSIRRKA